MLVGEVQIGVASVGSVVLTALPDVSTAVHSDVDPHDMPTKRFELSMFADFVHVGVAAEGFVEMSASPLTSAVAHSPVVGQETLVSAKPAVEVPQVGVAAVGLVVILALPSPSTAVQSDVDAHDTCRLGLMLVSICVAVQVGVAAVGLVEISTYPD